MCASSNILKNVNPFILFSLLIVGCWIWTYVAFGVFTNFGTIELAAFYFLTIFIVIESAHFIERSIPQITL